MERSIRLMCVSSRKVTRKDNISYENLFLPFISSLIGTNEEYNTIGIDLK